MVTCSFTKQVLDSNPLVVSEILDTAPVLNKEFFEIQAIAEYIFTLNAYVTWGQKKVVLFPQIDWVKIFYHLPTTISSVCTRIYIFCFKKHTRKQKIPTSKFIRTKLRFFPFKQ